MQLQKMVTPTIKISLLVLIASLFFTSCVEPIEFDPGDVSPYPVLVSRPCGDSTVSVYISKSRFFLANRSNVHALDDATVTLIVNGVPSAGVYDEGACNGYGGYLFPLLPRPGDSLRIEALVPGFSDKVSAVTAIPQQPSFEIVDCVIDTNVQENWGNIKAKIRFKVNCSGPNEYYAVRILKAFSASDTLNLDDLNFIVNDPIVNNSNFEDVLDGYNGSFWDREMFFSSELFTGGSHEFTAVLEYWQGYWESFSSNPFTLYLEVRALSPELYRYIRTTGGPNSELDELFGEPVQVFCNIDGGIGIFGGYTIKRSGMPEVHYGHVDMPEQYYYKSTKK